MNRVEERETWRRWVAELSERRVFAALAGHAVACFVLLQLADATFDALGVPPWILQSLISAMVLLFPVVGYLAWTFDFSFRDGLVRAWPASVRSKAAGALLVAMLAAALAASLWWIWLARSDQAGAVVADGTLPLPDVPSVGVVPFRAIGDAAEPQHFADGMTDDLITDLAQISRLFVVARNSAFEFKDRDLAPAEIAAQLGVRYVLFGSVRLVGEVLRVNAQLVDTQTGDSVWAARFDGSLAETFAFQDTVAKTVAEHLEVELSADERAAVGRQQTDDPIARAAFQRGWSLYRENTPSAYVAAIKHLDEAVERDPEFSRAYAARAAVYQAALARDFTVRIGEWTRSLGLKPDDVIANVLANLEAAGADRSPLTLQVQSQLSLWRSNFDLAIQQAQAAIELAPNDPLGHEALSAALTLSGQPDGGLAAIDRAMRLDPAYPDEYLFWRGLALFSLHRFEEAREDLELARDLDPGDDRVLIVLAAAYGHLSQPELANRTIVALDALQAHRKDERSRSAPGDILVGIDVQLEGRYTLTEVDLWPFRAVADREHLREGLRLGGLPPMGPDDNQIPLEVPGATTVSVDEAFELYEGGVAIVDVRGFSDRNIGFIPGSTFLNLQTMLSEEALRAVVDPDQKVLFHCEGMR